MVDKPGEKKPPPFTPEAVSEPDLHDFLLAIDAIYARPDDVSKEALVAMLWKAGQIIGQLMVLSELETKATLALERSEPEGHA